MPDAATPSVAELADIVAEHTSDIAILKNGLAQTQTTLAAMSAKQAEFHGENRARADSQEKLSRAEAEKTQGAIRSLSEQIARLGSVRGWIGWAIVTATSAGVATVMSHLATH